MTTRETTRETTRVITQTIVWIIFENEFQALNNQVDIAIKDGDTNGIEELKQQLILLYQKSSNANNKEVSEKTKNLLINKIGIDMNDFGSIANNFGKGVY